MAKERIIAGIDVGSSKICTVIAQASEEKISVIGVASTPSKGIKKGVVVDIDLAVESISASLEASERMAGYAVSQAFVSVGGSHISSLNSRGVVAVTNPDGEIVDDDIARATEAAQAISIPSSQEIVHVLPRDFIVDSQDGVKNPVGMSGVRLEVETNIIFGSSTSIRNLSKCVAQVGVDISGLVFGGLASSQSVLSDTEKELGTVLADIGGGTTQVCIFEGGSPYYSVVLPVGAQNITNDLAIGLRTSLEVAEKVKVKYSQLPAGSNETDFPLINFGIESSDSVSRKTIEEVVRARLSEIFNLVAAEVKKSGLMGKIPGGIVLTGGGSETKGSLEVARNVLRMPVRTGLPGGVTGLIDEIGGAAHSCPVGLLLFGYKSAPKSLFSVFGKGRLGNPLAKAVGWFKSFLP